MEAVNELTHKAGALVIYDEVITAFRFMYGGAQNLLGVTPDLTALGKKLLAVVFLLAPMAAKRDYGASCTAWACISSRNNGRQSRVYVCWNRLLGSAKAR
ncbi:hypothetical protein GCM10020331_088910 [Ectobacillus funiculus]